MYKVITTLFILIISFSAYSDRAPQSEIPAGLNDYIMTLTNEASTILNNPKLKQEEKINEARGLMRNNLDFEWMANYTLGRQGRKELSKKQKEEFIAVYSQYVTKAYTDLIKDYKGEKPKIVEIRKLKPTEFIVTMNIINRPGQDPIKVEYLIREIKENATGIFKISDIKTEGVSLIGAQQQEFSSILNSAGANNIDKGFNKLIQDLKDRS